MQEVVVKEKRFVCPLCGMRLSSRATLYKHVKRELEWAGVYGGLARNRMTIVRYNGRMYLALNPYEAALLYRDFCDVDGRKPRNYRDAILSWFAKELAERFVSPSFVETKWMHMENGVNSKFIVWILGEEFNVVDLKGREWRCVVKRRLTNFRLICSLKR